MAGDIYSLLVVLMVCAIWFVFHWHRRRHAANAAVAETVQHLLKPRAPDDCPACRPPLTLPQAPPAPPQAVRPWREIKSRRGAPKRIATAGFACPKAACAYYRVTDAGIHALVGDGTHGKHERIQTLRCQACGTTFTSRRDTPLYRLKTSVQRIGEVLTALAEGLTIA
ncbi:MAG: hypothetical protein M3380_02755, partial [Chloroflexota bacterium]|nr:hypothetical protein [Chloroflexota bacterium]